MANRFFIDSTIVVIATEQIGEAWSLVILEEIAKGRLPAWTDSFAYLELLDSYAGQGRRYDGKCLFGAFRAIMASAAVSVTVEDFDRAHASWKMAPAAGPREHLHAAVADREGSSDILSIDGPGYEEIETVHRLSMKTLLRGLELEGEYIEQRKV